MKRFMCLVIIMMFAVLSFSVAEGLIEVTDYSIPKINFNDKPEDYLGVWKCIYGKTAGKLYEYESLTKFAADNGITFDLLGESYSYAELGNEAYLICTDQANYEVMGPLCIKEPVGGYRKETNVDHPGAYMLQDGRMILISDVENDICGIYEKQTDSQLIDQMMGIISSNVTIDLASMNIVFTNTNTDRNEDTIAHFYCKKRILNEGTEFSQEFQGYFLPAGTYRFTNNGEMTTQITFYIDEKQIVDGWEEYKMPEDKYPILLPVDESTEIIIDDYEFIKFADGETSIFVERCQ